MRDREREREQEREREGGGGVQVLQGSRNKLIFNYVHIKDKNVKTMNRMRNSKLKENIHERREGEAGWGEENSRRKKIA